MHLTRGFLNPTSRAVLRDLGDPVGLHRTLLRAFPSGLGDSPRKAVGLLFRVDAGPAGALLVLQSKPRPVLTELPGDYFLGASDERLPDLGWADHPRVEEVDLDALVVAGARLAFRLRANTTRKIETKTSPDGTRTNGKRVPLRSDELRLGWLARRGLRDGFRVLEARVQAEAPRAGQRDGATLTHAGALFNGLLEVADAKALRDAVHTGVGHAKAYGFGLLSIRRA